MPALNSFSYIFGPIVAFAALGALILVLRWAFRRGASVVAAPAKPGTSSEYGMLVAIASPGDYVQGEIVRRTLEDAGIRANLASTLDGPKVMVWPKDESRARTLLANNA